MGPHTCTNDADADDVATAADDEDNNYHNNNKNKYNFLLDKELSRHNLLMFHPYLHRPEVSFPMNFFLDISAVRKQCSIWSDPFWDHL